MTLQQEPNKHQSNKESLNTSQNTISPANESEETLSDETAEPTNKPILTIDQFQCFDWDHTMRYMAAVIPVAADYLSTDDSSLNQKLHETKNLLLQSLDADQGFDTYKESIRTLQREYSVSSQGKHNSIVQILGWVRKCHRRDTTNVKRAKYCENAVRLLMQAASTNQRESVEKSLWEAFCRLRDESNDDTIKNVATSQPISEPIQQEPPLPHSPFRNLLLDIQHFPEHFSQCLQNKLELLRSCAPKNRQGHKMELESILAGIRNPAAYFSHRLGVLLAEANKNVAINETEIAAVQSAISDIDDDIVLDPPYTSDIPGFQAFLTGIEARMAPLANQQFQQMLQSLEGKNFGSIAENQELALTIQTIADRLNVAFRCTKPSCSKPARFRCVKNRNIKTGMFTFAHSTGTHTGTASIPLLILVTKPEHGLRTTKN